MVEKYKLNLAVGLTILLITFWLIWARRVWDWTGQLLLLGAIALIIWTLLLREKKPAKLLEFFLKSLVVSYVATGIVWFVWMGFTSPRYYTYLNLDYLMNTLVLVVLPLSLFPAAISVLIYGRFRIKLKPWEFLLSSWYVSMFVIFTIYQVWWSLFVLPYLPEFYYSSIAGAIAFTLLLTLLAFLIAGILTIIYVILKRPKSEPPP